MPYQKKLPMSAALRPGGEGVVPPPKGDEDTFGLGAMKGPKNTGPSGPTKIGKGVSLPKAPTAPRMPKAPKAPSMPKMPRFK